MLLGLKWTMGSSECFPGRKGERGERERVRQTLVRMHFGYRARPQAHFFGYKFTPAVHSRATVLAQP